MSATDKLNAGTDPVKVENKGPLAPTSRLGPFQYYMQAATASDVFPQTQSMPGSQLRPFEYIGSF